MGPLLFRDSEAQDRLAFREDAAGRITHAFLDSVPMIAFERLGVLDGKPLNYTLLGATLLLSSRASPAGQWRCGPGASGLRTRRCARRVCSYGSPAA